MTEKMQTRPVQENDNEEMETSVEEDELVKTCSDSGSEKDVDSESKTDKQVSTVEAVVAEEPKNKKAGGSGEAQPSAAFSIAHAAAVKSRKSERIKKMMKKVEDEEDREVSLTFGEDWFQKSLFVGLSASLGMDEESVKEQWASMPMEMKKETEWKWKVLHLEKLRCLLSKHELEYEVPSALANATP